MDKEQEGNFWDVANYKIGQASIRLQTTGLIILVFMRLAQFSR